MISADTSSAHIVRRKRATTPHTLSSYLGGPSGELNPPRLRCDPNTTLHQQPTILPNTTPCTPQSTTHIHLQAVQDHVQDVQRKNELTFSQRRSLSSSSGRHTSIPAEVSITPRPITPKDRKAVKDIWETSERTGKKLEPNKWQLSDPITHFDTSLCRPSSASRSRRACGDPNMAVVSTSLTGPCLASPLKEGGHLGRGRMRVSRCQSPTTRAGNQDPRQLSESCNPVISPTAVGQASSVGSTRIDPHSPTVSARASVSSASAWLRDSQSLTSTQHRQMRHISPPARAVSILSWV